MLLLPSQFLLHSPFPDTPTSSFSTSVSKEFFKQERLGSHLATKINDQVERELLILEKRKD